MANIYKVVAAGVSLFVAPYALYAAQIGGQEEFKDKLAKAIKEDDGTKIKFLVNAGVKSLQGRDEGNTDFIHRAQFSYDGKIYDPILTAANNIDSRDSHYDRTPLAWASYYSQPKTVQYLLNAKANVDAQDKYGNTALICAVNCEDSLATVKEFGKGLDYGYAPFDAYKDMLGLKQQEVVGILLGANAQVNIKNKQGESAFMCVGTKELAQMLINAKADLEGQDSDGCTALIRAVKYGQEDALQILINAGAKLDFPDKQGALIYAIECDHNCSGADDKDRSEENYYNWVAKKTRMVKVLIDAGANVKPKGIPLITLAVVKGLSEVVKLLVEAGANIDELNVCDDTAMMDTSGCTALMFAKGQLKMALSEPVRPERAKLFDGICQYLIQHGADTSLRNKEGGEECVIS